MRKFKGVKKALAFVTALGMVITAVPEIPAKAADEFTGKLTTVNTAAVDSTNKNIVHVEFNGDVTAKITFLEDGIFRYNVDPSGGFSQYATPRAASHKGRIQQYPDNSANYTKPAATVSNADGEITITSGKTSIIFDKETAKMTVKSGSKVVMEEKESLNITKDGTVQTLVKKDGENFYGGGTQNGRFVHTGQEINIANESVWTDGGVASPNPFYYTTNGYGVLRNTFANGRYNFGKASADTVTATHNENEFDAYYFVSDGANGSKVAQEILKEYYKVTGNPLLLPEYAFYEGHLNAYNRDTWSDTSGEKKWTIKGNASASGAGTSTFESGMKTGYKPPAGSQIESLNGTLPTVATNNFPSDVTAPYKYSARQVIDDYVKYDMPIGYFLPNDGYGAGYGQNGLGMTGGVNADGSSSAARLAAVAANVQNLAEFTKYANGKGIATGLWTQSYLVPDSNAATEWQLLRDFRNEVKVGGISTLKTDVAWVGAGYSMQLDGVKTAYDIATTEGKVRPNIISLDGWAGSQRYCGIWTGDQYGGNWEYIRFHVPTYIGTSLSGNPNIGSDMDGIFGGNAIVSTRDYQWKSFTPLMLNMDGWGSFAKMPYTFGDPYTGINRMYLKLKSQLLPYIYTTAASAANINTGNDDAGLPLIRAMFLEYPNDSYAYSKSMQYQYMMGSDILVAPIYQNTAADEAGNDIRNNIYLPDEKEVWVDYFTGEQYQGGQVLNNFDAPVWKLPLFVKNGAIIPMWEANNTPENINKANRIVEFWPEEQKSEYTAMEDDGKAVENKATADDEYGTITNTSYGSHVSTKYTSEVKEGVATLTAEASTGSYSGYNANKNTTFVVNVSKEPTGIVAKNGTTTLTVDKVTDKAAFDAAKPAAGKAVYFYDESPAIQTFASAEETEIADLVKDVKVSPKLYVKFATADAKAQAQTLVINGFVNDGNLPADKLNPDLAVPVLTENAEARTPNSITLDWTQVTDADSYELKIDGVVYAAGDALTYTHTDLSYNSIHTYQVRSRNADGYSEWSEEQSFKSAEDPWRNTPDPVKITYPGEVYGNHKPELAFDKIFQSGDGGFHSDGPTAASDAPLTVDYGTAYDFEKIEYYPRDDAGNGTVTKMKLETSMDGVHWRDAGTYNWDLNAATKTMEVNYGARYLRFTALQSVGGFFSASEIKVYKKDGSSSFAPGSTLLKPEVTDGDYTNMQNYLGQSEKDGDSFTGQIRDHYGDINLNNVYDVYDYAFTMFKLDGGTKKTGSVSGDALLLASDTAVKAGETFTVDVYASNIKNLNAFGQVIHYDPAKVEFVSCSQSPLIAQMEDLTINKPYGDGTAYLNLAYANRGDKKLYSGSDVLATITLKAKEDIVTTDANVIDLSTVTLIGPDFSFIESVTQNNPQIPEIPDVTTKQFTQNDFDITMTNAFLPTDDGTNISTLIQQGSYAPLFNGNKSENHREFEFKWHPDGAHPAEEVTLPMTMRFALKVPELLNKVVVYTGAQTSYGYPTEISVQLTYEDNTTSEEVLKTNGNYTWTFDSQQKVKWVDIHIKKAIPEMDMLTLAEIELFGIGQGVPVSGITADANNVTEMNVGDLADIKGKVTPDNASNPYYIVTSSDEDVVKIITLADENGHPVYKARAMKPGTSTIVLTAAGNENLSADYQITVTDVVDISGLQAAITKGDTFVSSTIYTEESHAVLTNALEAAKALLTGGSYTKVQVKAAETAILDAIAGLRYVPLEEKNLINKNAASDVTIVKVTSSAPAGAPEAEWSDPNSVLDYNNDTEWCSDYAQHATMPQSLWFDLGGEYELSDVTFLPRQGIDNDDILKAEILVSEDGTEGSYRSVGVFDFDYANGRDFKRTRFEAANARYVEFRILKTTNDLWAMMAEIRFYGTKVAASVDKDALQLAYDQYKDYVETDYTAETWAPFKAALDAAKAVLGNADATQADVDAAGTALVNAVAALRERPTGPIDPDVDTEALNALYNKYKAENLKQADYTADSWTAFHEAMLKAQSVLGNADATQTDVDKAAADLKAAYDGLTKKPTDSTEPSNPGGSGGNQNNGSGTGNPTTDDPKTGDTAPIAGTAFLLLGAAALLIFRKKKMI